MNRKSLAKEDILVLKHWGMNLKALNKYKKTRNSRMYQCVVDNTQYRLGSTHCAFCAKHFGTNNGCKECPVYGMTKVSECHSTPYDDITKLARNMFFPIDLNELYKLTKQEFKFLTTAIDRKRR